MQIYLTDIFGKKSSEIDLKTLSFRAKNAFSRYIGQNEKRALQCATADLLLKKAISLQTPPLPSESFSESGALSVLESEYGKPYVENAPEFSISHGENVVAVAVADKPEGKTGLDVQLLKEDISPSLLKGVLSPAELYFYNGTKSAPDKVKYFYKTFTEKESYVKFTGEGLKSFPREITDFKNAKFLTKYVFRQNELYCLTVCAENILSLKINVIAFNELV